MQRNIAAALCEAGADVIMGHHSHCVQPVEWHIREDGSSALIIYSLGNFLADQTALNPPRPKTQYGMVVNLWVSKTHDGIVALEEASVLPTLCFRDRNGPVSHGLLPLPNGGPPEDLESDYIRAWGIRAYDHVSMIIGEEWMYPIRNIPVS
jgi:hypothetical protein